MKLKWYTIKIANINKPVVESKRDKTDMTQKMNSKIEEVNLSVIYAV